MRTDIQMLMIVDDRIIDKDVMSEAAAKELLTQALMVSIKDPKELRKHARLAMNGVLRGQSINIDSPTKGRRMVFQCIKGVG